MIRDRLHADNILGENTRGVALIFIDDHSAQVHVAVLHADLDRGAMGPALPANSARMRSLISASEMAGSS